MTGAALWVDAVGTATILAGGCLAFVPKVAKYAAVVTVLGFIALGWAVLLDSLTLISIVLAGVIWLFALLITVGAAAAARKERAHGKRT